MRSIKNKLNNSGFGHFEMLIFLLVLAVIGFVGYYLYHSTRTNHSFFSVTPPSVATPVDLELLSDSPSQIAIDWMPSSTPGATYQVMRDGVVVAKTSGTTYTDTNVSPDTSYDYTVDAVLHGKISYQTDAISAAATTSCANVIPKRSTSTTYPLVGTATPLDAATMGNTNLFQGYQYGIIAPGGYGAENHIVGAAKYVQLLGYPDPNNAGLRSAGYKPTGSVGAGFDIARNVPASGGFDVCFKVSTGNWQHIHLVLESWPANGNWSEGETDFFEGNPQDMQIFIHPINCLTQAADKNKPNYCGKNVYYNSWPAGVGNGGVHLLGARWDPVHGYRFYLDGALYAHAPINRSVNPPIIAPTSAHHVSIQLQDVTQDSSSNVSATLYWSAAYSYKAN